MSSQAAGFLPGLNFKAIEWKQMQKNMTKQLVGTWHDHTK